MFDLVHNAIPVFVLLLALEAISYRLARHDHDDTIGYEARDTRTSLLMGLGNVGVNLVWKSLVVVVYAAIFTLTPLRMDPGNWWTWVALFFLDDLAYYAYHRAGHRIRLFWASHVVHHSSQHYNLSTALRQTWTPMSALPFWLPLLVLGFEPWMVLLAQAWNLCYQFWIHTERIGKLPRWFELIFNTPSHHRAHHGSQDQYLDKNYGGILIIWDRLFGTFEPEGERVRYGLTTNLETFNPVTVAFHEYVAIWRDIRGARSWRARLGYLLRGPGWQPATPTPCTPRGSRRPSATAAAPSRRLRTDPA
jgi:sterol desaturase/sphingolipid hydroxylase (fatty acid hydroxylase superfamily)